MMVIGDITVVGEQIGGGRVINIVAGTVYRHNISIKGIQTDAGAIEALAINSGAGDVQPTMVKIVGSAPSGSAPWAGMVPIRHSLVSDLGDYG